MKLKCKRCDLDFDYTGKKKPNKNYPVWTSCPRCRTSVEVKESENDK